MLRTGVQAAAAGCSVSAKSRDVGMGRGRGMAPHEMQIQDPGCAPTGSHWRPQHAQRASQIRRLGYRKAAAHCADVIIPPPSPLQYDGARLVQRTHHILIMKTKIVRRTPIAARLASKEQCVQHTREATVTRRCGCFVCRVPGTIRRRQ